MIDADALVTPAAGSIGDRLSRVDRDALELRCERYRQALIDITQTGSPTAEAIAADALAASSP